MNMNDMTKKLYPVTGMHCAACAGNVEKIVRKQEGVENASVNLATATLTCLLYTSPSPRDTR